MWNVKSRQGRARQAPSGAMVVASLASLVSCSASADTLRVGPTRDLKVPSEAATLAQDGDTILIDAGTYTGDVAAWYADNLTIRGVDGNDQPAIAWLDAAGNHQEGKAIWVLKGAGTTVESIGFLNAVVPDHNGAGIRQEGAGLTVRSCIFRENQTGILTGANPDSDIVIESCEFDRNGRGDGFSHNVYIGHVRSLTFHANYSHHAHTGHNLKSRAFLNIITANRIMDEATGDSSYLIDLPNGGTSLVIGNLLHEGALSENSTSISYAAEGATNPSQDLYVINNTFVSDRDPCTFLRVSQDAQPARLVNNIVVGASTLVDGPADEQATLQLDDPGLIDPAGYDYYLLPDSPAIDAGLEPGVSDGGRPLAPGTEYVHPRGSALRTPAGPLDIGAYEFHAPCYADLDGSGVLDLFDFLAFTNAFNAKSPAADCDGDLNFTLFDFLCFTNAFNAGC